MVTVSQVGARGTLENDGSVEGDPCQDCGGHLLLRRVPRGGWFLGCSNYPKGCTFKMAPNSHQMEEREKERAERRAERARKRAEREAAERRKAEEKARREPPPPQYCEGCFSRLPSIIVQAGLDRHRGC